MIHNVNAELCEQGGLVKLRIPWKMGKCLCLSVSDYS